MDILDLIDVRAINSGIILLTLGLGARWFRQVNVLFKGSEQAHQETVKAVAILQAAIMGHNALDDARFKAAEHRLSLLEAR